jgi:tetratricopeptide (TPR) repeat protein
LAQLTVYGLDAALYRAFVSVTLVVPGTVASIAHWLNPNRRHADDDLTEPEVMQHSLGRMAEYHDGLSASAPAVREPFELGLAAMRACRWDEAISHFKKAMAATGGVHLVALLNLTGVCNYTRGRADVALSEFEASARLAQRLHASKGRAQALNNIGLIHRDNGDLEGAREYLEASLALTRELDDEWAVAVQLGNIGNVWQDEGELDKALECHERALEISQEIRDQWGVACEYGNIGSVCLDRGEFDKALRYSEEAVAVAHSIGYRLGVVKGLANIANVHRKKGRFDKALDCEEEALAIARRAGYRLGIALDLGNIGFDLMSRKKHKDAVPKLAEALTLLLATGVADGPRQALTGLVRCEDKLGRTRVEVLLKESGLAEVRITDLLNRIDQVRMKRPMPVEYRQLSFDTAVQ